MVKNTAGVNWLEENAGGSGMPPMGAGVHGVPRDNWDCR